MPLIKLDNSEIWIEQIKKYPGGFCEVWARIQNETDFSLGQFYCISILSEEEAKSYNTSLDFFKKAVETDKPIDYLFHDYLRGISLAGLHVYSIDPLIRFGGKEYNEKRYNVPIVEVKESFLWYMPPDVRSSEEIEDFLSIATTALGMMLIATDLPVSDQIPEITHIMISLADDDVYLVWKRAREL